MLQNPAARKDIFRQFEILRGYQASIGKKEKGYGYCKHLLPDLVVIISLLNLHLDTLYQSHTIQPTLNAQYFTSRGLPNLVQILDKIILLRSFMQNIDIQASRTIKISLKLF